MKRCPVCSSVCYDDMDICFGCMHRFADEPIGFDDAAPAGEGGPEGSAPEHPSRDASCCRADAQGGRLGPNPASAGGSGAQRGRGEARIPLEVPEPLLARWAAVSGAAEIAVAPEGGPLAGDDAADGAAQAYELRFQVTVRVEPMPPHSR